MTSTNAPAVIAERIRADPDFDRVFEQVGAAKGAIRAELGPLDDFEWAVMRRVEREPDVPLTPGLNIALTRDERIDQFAFQLSATAAATHVLMHGRRCEHLRRSAPVDPVELSRFVLVTPSFVVLCKDAWICMNGRECAASFAVVNETDCDLCGGSSEWFREIGHFHGRMGVLVNACDECCSLVGLGSDNDDDAEGGGREEEL
jgi:hypothetical protein